MNNYPNKPTWLEKGKIADGVGTSGTNVRYGKLQDTTRASYIAVDPTNGGIASWLNGCNNLGQSRTKKLVMINLFEINNNRNDWSRTWKVYDSTTSKTLDVCNSQSLLSAKAETIGASPKFPTKLGPFKAHGISGCTYEGIVDKPGTLKCPGLQDATCIKDPQYNQHFACTFGGTVTPVVKCEW
jgi:hypothetical protein